MQMKPYVWAGRFYNHRKDSIGIRLSKAAWCLLGKLTRNAIRKKYSSRSKISSREWIVDASVLSCSDKPLITWIGHSTFMIQLGGINILTDPVFFGVPIFAKRVLKAGITIDKLPKIDFVIVSHNHCDHMDLSSLRVISEKDNPIILVPYGNKKWLERKGLQRLTEAIWWDSYSFGQSVKFTFLPAVHWTSRGIIDINTTLWGSWMIEVNGFKIYFAGDTAYSEHFKKIGQTFSSIDVALMPIGPIQPRKLICEAHTCPIGALQGFLDLNAKYFVPMHWGTFKSAYECFFAPAEELLRIWMQSEHELVGKCLKLLKVGQSVDFE